MKARIIFAALAVLGLSAGAAAQSDDADTARVRARMSVGSVAAAGFGSADVLMWVAPWVEWKATERLNVRGGLVAAGSLMPQGYHLQGQGPRSLAPRRGGTQAAAAWAEADFAATDRLRLWASICYVGGQLRPLWLDAAQPVEAAVLSGGFAYSFSNRSVLEMTFHVAYDHYGNMTNTLFGHPYYGPYAPGYRLLDGSWPF